VVLLKSDNVVSDAAIKESRTLAGIGIPQTTVEAILPTYLTRYRAHGQYSGTGNEA
jgi:NADH dehydrogenase